MLKVGIVGLPNVGKSTLFNALTKQGAKAQNVPFTTIEPNVGIVPVPDPRLDRLAEISKSKKVVPTTVEFVDIAGLVKGAHAGEGLGNKFLSNIRQVDAILHVVRFFDEADITHVDGQINPDRDTDTINTELALADLATVQKMRTGLAKKIKSQDKEAAQLDNLLSKYEAALEAGTAAREVKLDDKDLEVASQVQLLTTKPMLYVANISEDQISDSVTANYLPLSIKIEQELVELSDKERQTFLAEYGLQNTGLDRLIQASYELLGLITFFTSGEQETRAWTLERGAHAPQAAGIIHSDFEQGFIRAETVSYTDLDKHGDFKSAKATGLVRDEGKGYLVQDGDIMLFKFAK